MAEKAYWVEVIYRNSDVKPKQWRFVTEQLRESAIKAFERDPAVKRTRKYRAK